MLVSGTTLLGSPWREEYRLAIKVQMSRTAVVAVEIGPKKRLLVLYTLAETLASEEEKKVSQGQAGPQPHLSISLCSPVVLLQANDTIPLLATAYTIPMSQSCNPYLHTRA